MSAGTVSTTKCRGCGAQFDPKTDHAGHRGGPPRRFCSIGCREDTRNRRRRAITEHRRKYASLQALHEIEAAGQTALGGPLPAVPPLELP